MVTLSSMCPPRQIIRTLGKPLAVPAFFTALYVAFCPCSFRARCSRQERL